MVKSRLKEVLNVKGDTINGLSKIKKHPNFPIRMLNLNNKIMNASSLTAMDNYTNKFLLYKAFTYLF